MTTPRDPKNVNAGNSAAPGQTPGTPPAKNWVTRREAVDAYLDGELSRRSTLVRDAIRENPGEGKRLERTERILDELSAPMQTPDLTLSILDDVHMLRPFKPVSPPLWRMVVGWTAMAAAVVLAVGGYVVLQSRGPRTTPAPRSTSNDAVRSVFDTNPALARKANTPDAATRQRGSSLEMGTIAADAPRRWETDLPRTGLDEVELASLQPTLQPTPQTNRVSGLSASLARELGLTMKPARGGEAANLSMRREPFPVPPSAWLRRPVKLPSALDLSRTADPSASAWFAPSIQKPLTLP
ncbi:MAG: hypothetical protein SFY96_03865 [Planctomycetota bacterium]|nr:hypothetical protein [Planctomycetota bacterium]